MSFAIERRALEDQFGDRPTTVPEERLNKVVTHAHSRRFLAEVGLPQVLDFLYESEGALEAGLPLAVTAEPELFEFEGLPASADSWVACGYCHADMVILDGNTGTIWSLPQGELHAGIANTSVDRFARFLASFFRGFGAFGEGTTLQTRQAAAEALAQELRAVDPVAFADPQSLWLRVLDGLVHDYPA